MRNVHRVVPIETGVKDAAPEFEGARVAGHNPYGEKLMLAGTIIKTTVQIFRSGTGPGVCSPCAGQY